MSKQILNKIIWSNSSIPIHWFLLGLVSSVAVAGKMNDVSIDTFDCQNVEYDVGADFVTIAWRYTPQNGTPFWFKCFKGLNTSNYITHSFISSKTTYVGPIGNKTKLLIFKQDHWTSIKLKIWRPDPSEDGLHCCKLEGGQKTMKKCLILQGHAKPTTQMNMASTASYSGENQGQIAWFSMAVIPLGACAGIIYYWKTRKKHQGNKQRQEKEEELQQNLMV